MPKAARTWEGLRLVPLPTVAAGVVPARVLVRLFVQLAGVALARLSNCLQGREAGMVL